jgi:hypothetical protein
MKTNLAIVCWGALLALAAIEEPLATARAQVWKPSGAPTGYYWAAIACSSVA